MLGDQTEIGLLLELARRMAARWAPSSADAEDLAQEAIIRYLAAPAPPRNAAAWLFVVIRRVRNRSRLRNAARQSAEAAFSGARTWSVMDVELSIEVDQLLARVNDGERRIIRLLAAGAQTPDIAATLGCKIRDVGQIVSRARKRARSLSGRIQSAVR